MLSGTVSEHLFGRYNKELSHVDNSLQFHILSD